MNIDFSLDYCKQQKLQVAASLPLIPVYHRINAATMLLSAYNCILSYQFNLAHRFLFALDVDCVGFLVITTNSNQNRIIPVHCELLQTFCISSLCFLLLFCFILYVSLRFEHGWQQALYRDLSNYSSSSCSLSVFESQWPPDQINAIFKVHCINAVIHKNVSTFSLFRSKMCITS